MELIEQIIDAWRIHNRINLYMLEAIPEEAFGGVAASGGRDVAAEFAHMHNVRVMWLEVSIADQMGDIQKIPTKTRSDKDAITKNLLRRSLEASGNLMEIMLRKGFEEGKIKGFKPHPAAFLGYLISHDSYHRGEIGIILNQSGHPLDNETSYGMWEWGDR
jgi:uncharacterized damage-inducible protein DinB